jgi:hypothetical protein
MVRLHNIILIEKPALFSFEDHLPCNVVWKASSRIMADAQITENALVRVRIEFTFPQRPIDRSNGLSAQG